MKKQYKYSDEHLNKIQEITYSAIKNLYGEDVLDSQYGVAIEKPRDPSHGDWSTNIAMQIVKKVGNNPREIGEKITSEIKDSGLEILDEVEVAGPGFINFRLSDYVYKEVIKTILEEKEKFGASKINKGKTFLVEYTSWNPTGDAHVGHLKNTATGYALIKLFESTGAAVVKDMIDNNRGIAIARLMYGYLKFGRKDGRIFEFDLTYWNQHQDEWFTEGTENLTQIRFLTECYTKASLEFKEEDVQSEVKQILRDWENEKPLNRLLWKKVMNWIWEGYERILRRLNYWYFDKIWHEHEIYKNGKSHVERGINEGIFKVLEDGAVVTDLKKDFGLTDTILMRSNGTSLYITQDLELTRLKKEAFNPDEMFWVIGPEQELQMKQAFACASQLGFGTYEDFHHIAYGFLFRRDENGKQIKMSKRLGNLVYIDDLIDESKNYLKKFIKTETFTEKEENEILEAVAIGAIKYSLLKVNRLKDQVYDFETMLSFEGDSGPYIMYTYSRCKSVLLKNRDESDDISDNFEINLQNHSEVTLTKLLSEFPNVVMTAAKNFETHLVPSYIYQLAQEFNSFYTKLPILKAESPEIKQSRLALTAATAQVLKNGLHLLGIETVERM